jgi:hypothetical protein
MSPTTIRVLVETTPKKVFACAVDWPGWSRAGRDEAAAVEALLATSSRYAEVALAAGFPFDEDDLRVEVAERREGDAGTAFGVPSVVADEDRRPTDAAEAARQAALVEAAWAAFDRIAAAAPEELRKGPRGGGRDRTRIVDHLNGADEGYAGAMGLSAAERKSRDGIRARELEILREPSDGSPIAGKRWPPRYAARRIAWHALDHAWEIQDRTDPA